MKRALRIAAVAAIAAAASRRLRGWSPVRVAGESMAPTIVRGDLLAVRAPRAGEPSRGQIVIARAGDIEVVKRVVALPGERELGADEFWLQGDHAERSTDSRATGPVARESITAIVGACYWPPVRVRLFVGGRDVPRARRRPGGSRAPTT
jgi:type IV secretory pathway protease TraF